MSNSKLANSLIYFLVAFLLSYNLMEVVFFISRIRIMLMELAPSFLNVERCLTLGKRELLLFQPLAGYFDQVSLSLKIVYATESRF